MEPQSGMSRSHEDRTVAAQLGGVFPAPTSDSSRGREERKPESADLGLLPSVAKALKAEEKKRCRRRSSGASLHKDLFSVNLNVHKQPMMISFIGLTFIQ